MRLRTRSRVVLGGWIALMVAIALVVTGGTLGLFSTSESQAGNVLNGATFSPTTAPAPTATAGSASVSLTWSAVSLSGSSHSGTIEYTIVRSDGTSICTLTSTTTCTDTSGIGGTQYTYTEQPFYVVNSTSTWSLAVSASSNQVTYPAPSFVAAGTTQTWTANGAKTVALPTGEQVGDLEILYVANTKQSNTFPTAPSGWTAVPSGTINNASGGGLQLSTFYDFFATGDSGPSVNVSTDGGGAVAKIVAYRNVDTANPFDVTTVTSSVGTSQSTYTPTGLTTLTKNARAVSIVAENGASATSPTLSLSSAQGFTVEAGFPDAPASGTSREGSDVAGKVVGTAGSVTFPTYSTTVSGTSSVWTGASLALRPTSAPTVTGVSPLAGTTGGATSVTITGTGFLLANGVKFGGVAGTSVNVTSDSSLTISSPSHAAGVVDVTVSSPAGTSTTSSADQFTYDGSPTVTTISPNTGPTTGGTSVTVTGTGFLSATGVKFGAAAGTSLSISSDTSLTITAPAGSAGAVDLTVTNATGTSPTTSADQFTYFVNVPLFKAIGTPTTYTSSSTVTVNYPGPVVPGDLLFLMVCNNQENGPPAGTLTGWTQIADPHPGTMGAVASMHCRLYQKTTAAGSETFVSVTTTNVQSPGGEAWVVDFRKPTGSFATAGTATASSATSAPISPTATAITGGNVPANEIEFAVNITTTSLTLSTPGGFTSEGFSSAAPSGGTTATLGIADDLVTSASTPATATWTGANNAWIGVTAPYK